MAEYFQIEQVETVHILSLILPEAIDAVEIDTLNDAVLLQLQGNAQHPWIIDLTRTRYLGSAMLGLIVNFRQRIKTAGGKLILCGMSPRLVEIFRTCSMERLFTIQRTRPEALKTFSR